MTDETADAPPIASKTRTLLLGGLHIFALSALALAQQLFGLLGSNAEFFVARESRAIDIWFLIMVVLAVIPAMILLGESIVMWLSPSVYRYVQAAAIGLLAALFALQVAKQLFEAPWAVVLLGLGAGMGVGINYFNRAGFRRFFTWLAPAPLVIAGLFVLATPVSRLVLPQAAAATAVQASGWSVPVVVVVWDELNASTLAASDGSIDAEMFPSFARLADDGTWYRRATGVSEATTLAVPAILDGHIPNSDLLPIATDHPENLFTLLGNSHAVFAREPVTALCPTNVCSESSTEEVPLGLISRWRALFADVGIFYLHVLLPEEMAADLLPPIDHTWGGFGENAAAVEGNQATISRNDASRVDNTNASSDIREELLDSDRLGSVRRFIESIETTPKPPFVFLHAALPHAPYRYATSGLQYQDGGSLFGVENGRWIEDEWVVTQAQQRLLMQTQVTDQLLGDLIARLEVLGIYDKSLIIVTSDHGVGMSTGGLIRNTLTDNYAENMSVPFLVKLPGSPSMVGQTSDADVRTIDILPTVIDVLERDVGWSIDGVSLLDPIPERGPKQQVRSDGLVIEANAALDGWEDVVAAKARRFADAEGQIDVFMPGQAHPAGLAVADVRVGPTSVGSVEVIGLDGTGAVEDNGLSSTRIVGTVTFGDDGPSGELAVAVDGVVASVGPILIPSEAGGRFSYFVPEDLFAGTPGRLSFFRVDRSGVSVLLEPLTLTETRSYSTSTDRAGNEFLELEGVAIPIGDRIDGGLDGITIDGALWRITGWAADAAAGITASDIVIMLDGESVLVSPPNRIRRRVGEVLGNPDLSGAGFAFALPLDQVERAESVHVFAVIGLEDATEMLVVGS